MYGVDFPILIDTDTYTYTYTYTYTLLYKFFLIGTEKVYVYGNLYVSSDLYSVQWN